MGTLASEVDICNMALGWIGADRITSLDDDSTQANLCKLNYPRSRDAVLETRQWQFALRREELAPDPVPPAYYWGQRFQVPTDVLRVISVDQPASSGSDELISGIVHPEQIPWEIQGNYILCNFEVISVLEIVRVTATASFSEGFAHALAARLAADLSIPITNSRTMQSDMWSLYQIKLDDAAATDGMQGRSQRIRSRYLMARR